MSKSSGSSKLAALTTGARPVSTKQYRHLLVSMAAMVALCAIFLAGLSIPAIGMAGMATTQGTKAFSQMPGEFEALPPSQQSIIEASDGTELARFYAEDRIVVPLEKMSPWIQKAAVAIEDRRFFDHGGIDVMGMSRALVNNFLGGDTEGASTLTQQYVKNTLIETALQKNDPLARAKAEEHSVSRKLREAKYAITLEKKMPKKKILEGYLNIAPFGPNVYGSEAASRHYFSKAGKDLTIGEAALLAGITQNPIGFNPLQHPEKAQDRRNQVLFTMLETKAINNEQYQKAKAQNVKDMLKPSNTPQGCGAAGNAAHFCAYVVHEIYQNNAFGKDIAERRNLLMRGGLRIRTTLDKRMQDAAAKAATDSIPVNDPSDARIAVTSIRPGTGEILAMAQNTNFGTNTQKDPSATEQVFAADEAHGGGAGYQTGSSFKPMTLAAWYEAGYSPYAVVGGRTSYSASDWNIGDCDAAADGWEVHNNENSSPRATTVLQGTQRSLNTTYAGMASRLDLCNIKDVAKRVHAVPGDGSDPTFRPSDILGSGSVPPLNMANAFATFVNKGEYCKPLAISAVTTSAGKKLKVPQKSCKKALEKGPAEQTTWTLERTYNSYGSMGYASIGRPAIAKTGTTTGPSDAWIVGATPDVSTSVWVGHAQGIAPLADVVVGGRYYDIMYGSTLPANTWQNYMRAAHEGIPVRGFDYNDIGTGVPQRQVEQPQRQQQQEAPAPQKSEPKKEEPAPKQSEEPSTTVTETTIIEER
ncbi:transglycosylase domain-containing protein [Winkia sp. UMB6473-AN360BR]|nr:MULTISPECIES: transglycosylase domain-containing protein [Winkia]MDK7185488.1 transglycosylase domain-containing protein [Winkia sp. UMB1295B]MDK7228786.1 transglycosylase domain-containing protein [Winkia sp. UMB1185]MDK8816397.1 transglycosylase domain-containing protein [Winkia sp. UMB6473-AN360BR]NJJ15046.1 penicillin-binding protein [Winkia neuii]WEB72674.1 transglycosylase domain-containing protein [Winkia neuii]